MEVSCQVNAPSLLMISMVPYSNKKIKLITMSLKSVNSAQS